MPTTRSARLRRAQINAHRGLQAIMLMSTAICLAFHSPSQAQSGEYPSKPIRLIVPFAAGTSVDLVARIFAQRLSNEIGGAVIVETRPGGGSTLGTAMVAQAPADGYTLLLGSNSALTIAPHIQTSLRYDPIKSFAPIVGIFTTSSVMLANAELSVKNLQELIAYARQNPGKLSYGSYGLGTIPHLSMAILESNAGVSFNHIPYKGGSEAGQAVMAGDIDIGFETIPGASARIQSNKVKPIVIFQAKRSELLPDVPSTSESGMQEANILGFVGLFAPAATSPDVISKLTKASRVALRDPEFQKRLRIVGAEPLPMTGPELSTVIKKDFDSLGPLIKKLGIKPE